MSWALIIGGLAVTALVLAAMALAFWGGPRWRRVVASERLVLAGGLALPIAVLSVLLVWGLTTTAGLLRPDEDAMRVRVTGERWWWRVEYQDPAITGANELHVPVGRTVRVELKAADVIHSFWIPRLAGKLDMIPGRTNVLQIRADAPGVYRGQCAEYCGGPHALMAFEVIAHEPQAFARWTAARVAPAAPPRGAEAARGAELFVAGGCGACHTVRGTDARGTLGPDLTHVGARRTLAAGVLPNTRGAQAAWIAGNQTIKPGNNMPEFDAFTGAELNALAAYLEGLK